MNKYMLALTLALALVLPLKTIGYNIMYVSGITINYPIYPYILAIYSIILFVYFLRFIFACILLLYFIALSKK